MKHAIVYSSHTGNTAQLAETINEALSQEDCVYMGVPKQDALLAPLLYIGFWTDKGRADELTIAFLKTLKNKDVFLFGTAGFGGDETYFEKILKVTEAYLDTSNRIVGSFMCQGKMPISVLNRYEKMLENTDDLQRINNLIENYHSAEGHPSGFDLEALKLSISKISG